MVVVGGGGGGCIKVISDKIFLIPFHFTLPSFFLLNIDIY